MDIKIKDDIAKILKERVENTEFSTVEEYVNYILEEILKKMDTVDKKPKEESYSAEEEKEVSERLKSLGYLD